MSQPTCDGCSETYDVTVKTEGVLTAAGWCAPSALLFTPKERALCPDCRIREIMIMQIGVDPGVKGENLRVARGGIKYGGSA